MVSKNHAIAQIQAAVKLTSLVALSSATSDEKELINQAIVELAQIHNTQLDSINHSLDEAHKLLKELEKIKKYVKE